MRPTSSDSGRQRGIRAVPPAREAGAIEDLIILARAGAPFEQALERILRATIRSFDAEAAGLYLLDERARRLKPRLAATFEPDGVVRLGRPPGDGIRLAPLDRGDPLLRALATGRVQLVEDTRTLAGVAILKTMPEGRSPGGMVAVLPLLAFEQNIGVLFIRSPAGGLRASDRVLLEAFVNEVGQAIERSSIPAVDGAGLRITLLNRAALDLQSDIASDRIFCKIVHGAVEALGVRRGILCLFDHERGVLTGKAAVDRDAPDEGESFRRMVEKLSIPVTDPDEVLAATVLDRRSFALPPAAGHGEQPTRATALPEELRRSDLLVTPLTAGPVVVGVLALFGRPDRGSPTDDLYWLRAFAAHAGHATLRAMAGRHFSDSESRYRRFVEESPDGIVETTLDGRILFCNDAAPRLLGCTREELLRRNARSFYVHPEQRDELIKLNDQRGRVESMDVSVKRQDGTISHVSLSTRLSQGPDGPLLRVSFRDVSERHELERRMRLLVDAVTYSADAIVSLDPSGKIVSWNQGAEAIYGDHR
ncbi:MAG: PAS domain S-box protein, partial [Acidobacteriota bacterium]